MEYKTGDLVCFKTGNDWLGNLMKLVNNKVGHVGMLYSTSKNLDGSFDLTIVEEVEEGIAFNVYNEGLSNIAVKGIRRTYVEKDMKDYIDKYIREKKANGTSKYSKQGLLDASISVLMSTITFGLWKKHRVLPEDGNAFCSEMYSEIFNGFFNEDILHEEATISPLDLYGDDIEFKIKKEFGR